MEEVGKKLNMSKGDTLKFKQHIEDDKEKIVQEKKNKEELIKQFEMEKLKVVKQDHALTMVDIDNKNLDVATNL
jgi:copper oxidase (laccase) domain-containing protein